MHKFDLSIVGLLTSNVGIGLLVVVMVMVAPRSFVQISAAAPHGSADESTRAATN